MTIPKSHTFALNLLPMVVSCASLFFAANARGDWKDAIGYNQLVSILDSVGLTVEEGSGVPIALVESVQIIKDKTTGEVLARNYKPNLANTQFNAARDPNLVAVVFTDGSNNTCPEGCLGYSNHATGQATIMFGNTGSIAPSANAVTLYEANYYLSDILNAPSGGTPETQNFRVQNFSWIGTFDDTPTTPPTPQQTAEDVSALRRFDFMINRDNVTAVVGLNNNTDPLPPLLTQSYNSIAVGRTIASHGTGPTNLANYGPGRMKPDLVAPQTTSSASTSTVSSLATMLHSKVAGTDADQSEVMKAILMAGATKHDNLPVYEDDGEGNLVFVSANTPLAGWDRTTTRPIDQTFGAGQVNAYNSYLMTLGGRFAGSTEPASAVGSYGWDYQSVSPGLENQLKYNIVVPAGTTATEFSVLLNWNVDVAEGFTGQVLANLDMTLTNSTGDIIDQSFSTVDNVEHIYIGSGQSVTHLDPGTYTLTISTNTEHDFGLAWRTSTLADVATADFDGDGDVDGRDFLAWQRGFGKLVNALHSDGDADGDGDVDQADLAVYQALFPPMESELPTLAAFAVPEPGTLAVAASGLLIFFLRRRSLLARPIATLGKS